MGVLALRPNATRFVRAGFLRPTYHSVKQLSSDAAAPLRLLMLLSASKLIPKLLLSPDAPVSAVVQKEGGRGYFKTHEFSLIGSPVQPSNLAGEKHWEGSAAQLPTRQVINDLSAPSPEPLGNSPSQHKLEVRPLNIYIYYPISRSLYEASTPWNHQRMKKC